MECGAAEDRLGNGAFCPRMSVVLGDVIDIGESAWRFVAAGQIAAMTRHEYSDQGVNKILRGWDFIERTAGMDWSCVRSLDTAVASHVAVRAERWKDNLRGG